MSELSYENAFVISSSVTDSEENITSRKTIVYKTLIDPATIRILGEKNKHKLFNQFILKLNDRDEIEYVSTEKYYEPYITVGGSYLIDYYRKCTYAIRVCKEVTEVDLLNNVFIPKHDSNFSFSQPTIELSGEERLVRKNKTFLFLDRNGHELNVNAFPPASSEENPQELIESFKMPEVDQNMDIEIIRQRIARRPTDLNRVVTEQFEIDERSVIYRPVFKITYSCPKIGKEGYFEFDGITSKMISSTKNGLFPIMKAFLNELK